VRQGTEGAFEGHLFKVFRAQPAVLGLAHARDWPALFYLT
jgi:hypothetical protein